MTWGKEMMDTTNSRMLPDSARVVKNRGHRGRQYEISPSQDSGDASKQKSLPWYKSSWIAFSRKKNNFIKAFVSLMALSLFVTAGTVGSRVSASLAWNEDRSMQRDETVNIVLATISHFNSSAKLGLLPLDELHDGYDYGGLNVLSRKKVGGSIMIESNDVAEMIRGSMLEGLSTGKDANQPYWNKEGADTRKCREVTWMADTFPTCNLVHENVIGRFQHDGYEVSYLNSGAYRDAFRFKRHNPENHFVLKRSSFKRNDYEKDIAKIHNEANLLEKLSSSPHILDIYGHCGTSVLAEPMAFDLRNKAIHGDGEASQDELNAVDHFHSLNNFTTSEKLQISIDMAKSLAELHGYRGGPIIHADANIEQWLIALDGSIKLNDFNNGRPPTWDAAEGTYCLRHAAYSAGFERSPEEYNGDPSDEKVDIFALGSSIYPMLTGLWPFYDELYREVRSRKIAELIVEGKRAFIDPRYKSSSFIEGKLVELIENCWGQSRLDRPSAFEIVSFLENVKAEAIARGELKPSSLINIPMPIIGK